MFAAQWQPDGEPARRGRRGLRRWRKRDGEGEKKGKLSLPMQHKPDETERDRHWHAIGDGGKLQAYS